VLLPGNRPLLPPCEGNWSRHCRSHLISAVELGCLDRKLSSFFFCFFFFLPAFPSFPQRNFEPGSPSNDDRQLRRPLASLVLWGALPSRPRRAALSGYCAVVRTPLHSPTTDAAVPLTFSPPQQPRIGANPPNGRLLRPSYSDQGTCAAQKFRLASKLTDTMGNRQTNRLTFIYALLPERSRP